MAEIIEVLDGVKGLLDRSGLVIERVNSPELLDKVLRLRYQVYCNERKFVKPQNCPDEIESDRYDPYSIHFAASDRYGVVGAMRLVLDSPYGFPFEEHCRGGLYADIDDNSRKAAAEISRLVISKSSRRRVSGGQEYFNKNNDSSHDPEVENLVRRFKPIALGMYREIYIETKAMGIKYWYALMEKPLYMLLQKYGFEFMPIGKEVDLYGIVTPYIANLDNIDKMLQTRFPTFARK